jgi:hypothetical protein
LLGNALTALGRSTAFSLVKIGTVVMATALELVLIPYCQKRWGNGGLGVVVAFLIAEVVLFSGSLCLMPRGTIGTSILVEGGRALATAGVTGLFLRWLPPVTPWLGIPLCIVVFTLCSMALGLLRRDDLHALRAQFRREPPQSPATPAIDSPGGPAP